jgi:hypothetical protein
MARFVLACCTLGSLLLCGTANAQCRSGGSGIQGSGSTAAGVLASYGMGISPVGYRNTTPTGPGSQYYDLLMSQMMAQQLAQ